MDRLIIGKHRLDLVVEHTIIVELKAGRAIIPVHMAQIQSYLHASHYKVGLLLNFGTTELQYEIIPRLGNDGRE
jgi:GxxExxY protein